VYEVWGYPWDGSDDEGSISKCLERYMLCVQAGDCAARVVAYGSNVLALRRIARDYENLGELANQARAALHDIAEMAQQQAITADLVAREHGYGAIGR
jgi:hypothetical protein